MPTLLENLENLFDFFRIGTMKFQQNTKELWKASETLHHLPEITFKLVRNFT